MAVTDSGRASRPQNRLEDKRTARIVDFVVIPVLIILVLLLPPISLAQRVGDLGAPRIGVEGGAVSDPDGTQVIFTPGTYDRPFRAVLSSEPRLKFLEGSVGKNLLEAAKAIPTNLVMKSPFYQLAVRGAAPTESTWVMPIPNDSEPYETLDLYAWDQMAQTWQWLPHSIYSDADGRDILESRVPAVPRSAMVVQTNPQPAIVSSDIALANNLPAEGQGALAQVHPTGLYLGDNGTLSGAVDAGFDQTRGVYAVVPVIRNYEGPIVRSDLLANMLVDEAQREAHISALVDLAVANLYEGVDIDYRGLDQNLRGEFNQFVKELADRLHEQGKKLSVRVEPPSQVSEDRWETGPYDWQTLGLLADTVKIPAPVNPDAYVAGGQLDALLNYAVGQINRYKLQLTMSGQSVEQAGNYLLQKNFNDALQPLIGRIETDLDVVEPGQPLNLALVATRPNSGLVYDPNIGVYKFKYQDDQGVARTVWLENAASLSHKLELLKGYNLQGFTLENLPAGGEDADLWPLMRDYQQGMLKPIDSNFVVEWRLRNGDGEVVSQVRPLTDPNAVMMAPQSSGELQIEAAILDRGNVVAQQGGTPVAIATYTATPSPTPEFTPTPEATPTPDYAELLVTSATANVRSGPSTAYPRTGQVRRGETYRITGRNEGGDWYQIIFDGDPAWLTADLVSVNGPTDAVALVEVEPPPAAAPAAAAPAGAAQPAAAAAAPAPRPSGGGTFAYGVQIDPYGPRGETLSRAANLGFSWIKVQVPWKDFEGSKGNRNFPDDVVNDINSRGLRMLASIVKSPTWSRNPSYGYAEEGPPQNPQDYADFVGAFAARYCGKVQAIEVWNEQNLPREWGHEPLDAGRYVQLLAAAYRSIKAACPQMIVVSGAPTPTGAPPPYAIPDFQFLEQMYQAGLKNYSDAIGVHPSGYGNPPDMSVKNAQAGTYSRPSHFDHPSFYFRDVMEQYRNIMVKYGDGNKRLWPTEFGWASTGSPVGGYEYAKYNSEQQQGEYIAKAYDMMKAWGFVGSAFLWNMDYNVSSPGSELAAFGIMGRPAESYLQGKLR